MGDAFEILHECWKQGRPIVPFLGAGASAGSGFPTTVELRDYLCKVKFHVDSAGYSHLLGDMLNAVSPQSDPRHTPASFLAAYGWPDFNALDADLWSGFERPFAFDEDPGNRNLLQELLEVESEAGLESWKSTSWVDRLYPPNGEQISNRYAGWLKKHLGFRKRSGKKKKGKHARSRIELKWGTGRNRLQSAISHTILREIEYEDERVAVKLAPQIWKMKLKPRIDWFKLLLGIAEGNLGVIDALFNHLNHRREPANSHILMAHLARLLNWKLLLTINFDNLLETAFKNEGLQPHVFDVTRDESPPDPALVRDHLSIIKLHGSLFNLRMGETLDHALDDATRNAILAAIPEDALLLVLGFSGYERRMLQLIHSFINSRKSLDRRRNAAPQVLWMRWEPKLTPPVRRLKSRLDGAGLKDCLRDERLADAGAFLLETYQHLTGTLPKTRSTLTTLSNRLIAYGKRKAERPERNPSPESNQWPAKGIEAVDSVEQVKDTRPAPFMLFCRSSMAPGSDGYVDSRDSQKVAGSRCTIDLAQKTSESHSPYMSLSEFQHGLSAYRPVWVDLTEHHTIAGVMQVLSSQLRVYDPQLPPFMLPPEPASRLTGDSRENPSLRRAHRYLQRALRRGRYVIAFAALEGFGREQTSQHGLPRASVHVKDGQPLPDRKFAAISHRLQELIDFLVEVCELRDTPQPENLTDFHIAVAVDEPIGRHLPLEEDKAGDSPQTILEAVRGKLCDFINQFQGAGRANGKTHQVITVTADRNGGRDPAPGDEDFPFSVARIRAAAQRLLSDEDGQTTAPKLPGSLHLNESFDDVANNLFSLLRQTPVVPPDGRLSARHPLRKHDVRAFLLLMSFFRRPRTRASLVSLTNSLLPRDAEVSRNTKRAWLREILGQLETYQVCGHMDGGYFWIPQYYHEWLYKLFSEPCRRQQLMNAVRDQDAAGLGDATQKRLLMLLFGHSRIARSFYRDVFQRTHDLEALFEYLYHRVSALKYAFITRCVLRTDFRIHRSAGNDESESASGDGVTSDNSAGSSQTSDSTLPNVAAYDALTALLDIEGVPTSAIKDSASADRTEDIDCLRLNWLRGLYSVLRREEPTFLSAASAETWLAWVAQLKQDLDDMVAAEVVTERTKKSFFATADGILRRCDSVVNRCPQNLIAKNKKELAGRAIWSSQDIGPDERRYIRLAGSRHVPELFRVHGQIQEWLKRFQARLYREQGDHVRCCDHQLSYLESMVEQLSGKKLNDPVGRPLKRLIAIDQTLLSTFELHRPEV